MFVAFLDLLGFASAVESLSDSESDYLTELAAETVSGASAPMTTDFVAKPVQELYARYVSFQRHCEGAARLLGLFDAHSRRWSGGGPLKPAPHLRTEKSTHHTIVFSDSVFLASTHLEPVLDAAGDMIVSLLMQGIPCRGAVARGHFQTFEWNLRALPTGSFRAHAPFLGSGVIRAYRAESQGPRGIRLIVHDSCRAEAAGLDSWGTIDLPPDEAGTSWHAESNLGIYGRHDRGFIQTFIERAQRLSRDAPDQVKVRHYQPTFAAFARMAALLDTAPARTYTKVYDWRDSDD